MPLAQIGGQGVFVKEVQAAVLEGRADLAVHSAKDLPPVTAAGLVLAAVPERRPTPATPWSAGSSTSSGRGPWWPPARPGAGPSWPTCGPT